MQLVTDLGAFTRKSRDVINQNFSEIEADFYVDAQFGYDGNDGKSSKTAFKTFCTGLNDAMAAIRRVSQDRIVVAFTGVLTQEYATPIISDVTIVGAANKPRQATTSGVPNGGGATWLSPTSGTGALLTVNGQAWTVENVYFNNSATAAPCIDLVTVGDPPLQADAAHFHLVNCILTGSDNGLDATDGTNFVWILNSTFFGFSGSGDIAINATGGVGTLLDWRIVGCKFFNNAANITAALSHGTIAYCQIENGSASNINLTNGTAPNFVIDNAFNIAAASFDPDGGTTGVSGDVWSNILTDTIETGLPTN